MARALEISESREGSTRVLALVGRLDTNTSAQLDAVARRLQAPGGAEALVVDLGQCLFVSSAGLRVIVSMQKRASVGARALVFRNVSPDVMETFRSTGFDDILTFE